MQYHATFKLLGLYLIYSPNDMYEQTSGYFKRGGFGGWSSTGLLSPLGLGFTCLYIILIDAHSMRHCTHCYMGTSEASQVT